GRVDLISKGKDNRVFHRLVGGKDGDGAGDGNLRVVHQAFEPIRNLTDASAGADQIGKSLGFRGEGPGDLDAVDVVGTAAAEDVGGLLRLAKEVFLDLHDALGLDEGPV